MTPKDKKKFLEYLGITEKDLDEDKFNLNFNESEIKVKLIEYLENENKKHKR